MRRPHLLRSTAAGMLAAAMTRGATPNVEPFDYPAGSSLTNQNGGLGWAGPWTPPGGNGVMTIEAGSLTHPHISSSGGRLHVSWPGGTGTTTTAYRDLSPAITAGTWYIRFLARNVNGNVRYHGVGLFDDGTERALIGQGSGFTNWTLSRVAGIVTPTYTNVLVSSVSPLQTSLLVLRVDMQDGPERVTFWVNPDLSQPESAATAVGGQSWTTDGDYVKITRIRVGGGGSHAVFGNPTEHELDELVITPISPFAPPALAATASGSQVALAWPAEYRGWTLQTNAAGVGAAAAWGDVADTAGVSSTNLPADWAQPGVFFRLRSP